MPDPARPSDLIAALARAGQSLWYHGLRRELIASGGPEARRALRALEALGISMKAATDRLLEDGLRLFAEPYRKLLFTIERRREAAASAHP